MILGGGVSKKADRFLPYVKVHTPVVPAVLQNNAGIVGAAMAASAHR
jgi:polyphosphate glucokinase